jgi:hypothetical protein
MKAPACQVFILHVVALFVSSDIIDVRGGEHMSVFQISNEQQLHMVYKNAVVARDGDRYIVVHSKRTLKPLVPFEITNEVYEHWKKRDNRVGFTDTPFQQLLAPALSTIQHDWVLITDFDEIQFTEE